MTIEVDDRYAKAKARMRRSDRQEWQAQFRSAYGERGEAVLARITTSGSQPADAAGAPATRAATRSRGSRQLATSDEG